MEGTEILLSRDYQPVRGVEHKRSHFYDIWRLTVKGKITMDQTEACGRTPAIAPDANILPLRGIFLAPPIRSRDFPLLLRELWAFIRLVLSWRF
jgi:hypothetical protein